MQQNTPFTTIRRSLLASAVVALLGACASAPTTVNLADTLAKDPAFSTFNSLIAQAGMAETLKSGGPYTIFAPTNEAFQAVPADVMEELSKDHSKLKRVLNFHIVNGTVLTKGTKSKKYFTRASENITVASAGDFLTVENALITQADTVTWNGYVNTIDSVMMPPEKKK